MLQQKQNAIQDCYKDFKEMDEQVEVYVGDYRL